MKNIKSWIIVWVVAFITFTVLWVVYSALEWNWKSPDLLEKQAWEILLSEDWNQTQLNIKKLREKLDWISDYSLDEVDTGAKWIDWKAIYKRTFQKEVAPTWTSAIPYNIWKVENLWSWLKIEWNYFVPWYSRTYNLSFANRVNQYANIHLESNWDILASLDNFNVTVNALVTVTVYYTKNI